MRPWVCDRLDRLAQNSVRNYFGDELHVSVVERQHAAGRLVQRRVVVDTGNIGEERSLPSPSCYLTVTLRSTPPEPHGLVTDRGARRSHRAANR
jgi:hypothetical protein